jgi:hypothetical protein
MKLSCIIDACSYINLGSSSFGKKTILNYLDNHVNLKYPSEVNLEILDHYNRTLPTFLRRRRGIINPSKYSTSEYEKRMLGKSLPRRKKGGNKGEVDCFLLSIDQIHYFKKAGVIFITDDMTALRGILNEWIESFPGLSVWSSLDVILFLYMEKVIPSADIALDMIKNIVSLTAPSLINRTPEKTQEMIKSIQKYQSRITKIAKF